MTKSTKKGLLVVGSLFGLSVVSLVLWIGLPLFALQADSIRKAGTWEDDPKNWLRAFNEEPPAGIQVIHSKYWRSVHFTVEFMYFFEVQATPEWRDAFLKKKGLDLVSPRSAQNLRTAWNMKETPDWFAPDPVDEYEVRDRSPYAGSVWINRTTGHIFFYGIQL